MIFAMSQACGPRVSSHVTPLRPHSSLLSLQRATPHDHGELSFYAPRGHGTYVFRYFPSTPDESDAPDDYEPPEPLAVSNRFVVDTQGNDAQEAIVHNIQLMKKSSTSDPYGYVRAATALAQVLCELRLPVPKATAVQGLVNYAMRRCAKITRRCTAKRDGTLDACNDHDASEHVGGIDVDEETLASVRTQVECV